MARFSGLLFDAEVHEENRQDDGSNPQISGGVEKHQNHEQQFYSKKLGVFGVDLTSMLRAQP